MKDPMDQLLNCWLKKIKINTVRTVMNNENFSLFVLSVDGMIRKEALCILATLS